MVAAHLKCIDPLKPCYLSNPAQVMELVMGLNCSFEFQIGANVDELPIQVIEAQEFRHIGFAVDLATLGQNLSTFPSILGTSSGATKTLQTFTINPEHGTPVSSPLSLSSNIVAVSSSHLLCYSF